MNTRMCWSVVLVGILLLPKVAASADAAAEACQGGKACLEKGDFNAAMVAYTEAIRLDPKLAEAYLSRGRAYEEKAEHAKAIAGYAEAIRVNPKLAEAYLSRGGATRKRRSMPRPLPVTRRRSGLPEIRRRLLRPGRGPRGNGRPQQGHCGLYGGHSAQPEQRSSLLRPGLCLRKEGQSRPGHC